MTDLLSFCLEEKKNGFEGYPHSTIFTGSNDDNHYIVYPFFYGQAINYQITHVFEREAHFCHI